MSTDRTVAQSFAFIHEGNETAVYTYVDTQHHWSLLAIEKGDAAAAVATARAMGAAIRSHSDLPHLRQGGVWQDPVYSFEAPTAVQRIETEIANLRAEAHRRRESAGYSGEHHDGGARYLTERADGMKYALDLLAADHD